MAKGTSPGAPTAVLNSILVVTVQRLDKVDVFSSAILPMDLADLGIVMKEIKAALAATAATTGGVDLSDSIGRDGDFVDFLFGERLTAAVGVPEFTATGR